MAGANAKPIKILSGISANDVPKSHWRDDTASKHTSRITPNRDMYIVFTPAQVLPFFLVTYGPKNAARSHAGAALHTGLDAFGDTREAPHHNLAEVRSVKEEKKDKREQRVSIVLFACVCVCMC